MDAQGETCAEGRPVPFALLAYGKRVLAEGSVLAEEARPNVGAVDGFEVIEPALGVDGVVEHDRVQDQPERAELLVLAGRLSRPRPARDSASSLAPGGSYPRRGPGGLAYDLDGDGEGSRVLPRAAATSPASDAAVPAGRSRRRSARRVSGSALQPLDPAILGRELVIVVVDLATRRLRRRVAP
jgi:hypothetical protein